MDFSAFDLTDAADGGVWLHLKSPFDGSLLYADDKEQTKPCRVLVRGNHSDEMRKLIQAHERQIGALSLRLAKAENDKTAKSLMAAIDDAKEAHQDALIQCAVIDWQNIVYAGKAVDRTDDMVLKVFSRKLGDLRAQVFRKAASEADFFQGCVVSLTLAARQLGWLHATPEGWQHSRAKEGYATTLPDLTGLDWAWRLWIDAGMVSNTGGALGWSEIAAFAEVETLEPWHRRLIRDMSKAYCEGLQMTSPFAIAPIDLGDAAHD